MKNKIIIFLLLGLLLLCACTNAKVDNEKTNTVTSLNETLSTPNTDVLAEESTVYDESDFDAKFAEIEAEAEEMANKSNTIESGEIFDSIKSIHEDVSLTEMDKTSLILSINVSYKTPEDSVKQLFDIVDEICANCNLEEHYSCLIFYLKDSNGFSSNMVFTDYKGITDFVSTLPVIFDKFDYGDIFYDTYYERYSSHDIMSSFK